MKPVFRNSVIYTLGNVLPQAINLALLPVLTRFLDPKEFGVYAFTSAWVVFLQVFASLSLHSYVLREYASTPSEEERVRMVGAVFLLLLAVDAAVLTACLTLLPRLMPLLGVSVPFAPYMKLACWTCALDILGLIPLAILRVRDKAVPFILISTANVAIGSFLSLYLIIQQDMGLLGRYYGLLGASAAMAAFYACFMASVCRPNWDSRLARSAVAFCLPLLPAAVTANISNLVDRFLLERFAPLEQLGLFSVGYALGNGVLLISNGIYKAVEPTIYAMADAEGFNARLLRLKHAIFLVLLAVAACVIFFAREAIALLASAQFRPAYRVSMLISFALLVQGVAIPGHCYFIAMRKTKLVPVVTAAAAAMSVLFNLALIPRFGIIGAGAAYILTSAGTLLFVQALTQSIGSIRWGFGRDLAIAAAVCALVGFLGTLTTSHLWLDIGWKCLAAGVGLGLAWHCLDDETRDFILRRRASG